MLKITKDKVSFHGRFTFTTRDAKTGKIKRQKTVENIVVTAGRSVFAQRLIGDTTYTGTITHGALGSSTTTPSNADTQLGTEIANARVTRSSETTSNNIAYLSFFFPQPASPITYEEFGTFIDGTASANTGQLFSHLLLSGSIAVTETLTVDATYTIT